MKRNVAMKQTMRFWVCGAFSLLSAACGGSPAPEPEEPVAVERRRSEDVEPQDGAEITGILGTLSTEQIRGALEPRMMQFQRCIAQRTTSVEYLSGDIQLAFHVRRDGGVLWAYPSVATLGDAEVEACILTTASAVHFPQPRGGEAEFTWGFSYDPPEDVRPAVTWDASQASNALAEHSTEAIQQCGLSGVRVTAYVAPGGAVVTSGASTSNAESVAGARCMAETVRSWTFPDPGSYPAKISFDVVPVERPAATPSRTTRRRRR